MSAKIDFTCPRKMTAAIKNQLGLNVKYVLLYSLTAQQYSVAAIHWDISTLYGLRGQE